MGTVYCLHHDEEELIGSEPVPCPFCGFGAEQAEAMDELDARGISDSSDALQHVLMEAQETGSAPSSDEGLRGYW